MLSLLNLFTHTYHLSSWKLLFNLHQSNFIINGSEKVCTVYKREKLNKYYISSSNLFCQGWPAVEPFPPFLCTVFQYFVYFCTLPSVSLRLDNISLNSYNCVTQWRLGGLIFIFEHFVFFHILTKRYDVGVGSNRKRNKFFSKGKWLKVKII